jgi:hypothetical protein
MTDEEFEVAILKAGRTSKPVRQALHDILVLRVTWRQASIRHDVTESGILRAMRRMNLAGKIHTRMDMQMHQPLASP